MNQVQFHEKLELDAIKWIVGLWIIKIGRPERRLSENGMYRLGFQDGLTNGFRFSLDGVVEYREGLCAGKKKRTETGYDNTLTGRYIV